METDRILLPRPKPEHIESQILQQAQSEDYRVD